MYLSRHQSKTIGRKSQENIPDTYKAWPNSISRVVVLHRITFQAINAASRSILVGVSRFWVLLGVVKQNCRLERVPGTMIPCCLGRLRPGQAVGYSIC